MQPLHYLSAIITVAVSLIPTADLHAQWTTLSIAERYDTWVQDNGAGSYTSRPSPINLRPDDFLNQSLGDPQVVYSDNGDWLITGYGDNNLNGDLTVCDQSYVIRRPTNGSFRLPSTSALKFPPESPQCRGYLGVGPAVTKTTTATPLGYRYFAVIPASDYADHAWLTWAVSQDGQNWAFLAASGSAVTSDPRNSFALIRRPDLRAAIGSGTGLSHLQHVVMQYNKFDGYFYISVGYATDFAGIYATWWRLSFDNTQNYGLRRDLTGAVEVQRRNGSAYVLGTGFIPTDDNWAPAAQDPKFNSGDDPVDPMGFAQLLKPDGSFDSWIFLYQPVASFGSLPSPIRYVKGTSAGGSSGNLGWGDARTLFTSAVFGDPRYVTCPNQPSPSTVYVNQSGWQTDGSPQLYGFITVSKPESCSRLGQQGILMLRFNLNNSAAFYTVTPCRVLDTRNPSGPFGGPALQAGSQRSFQISTQCGIPPGARAVSVNGTVTQSGASGYLSYYPAGQPVPNATAINYSTAQTRANNAIVTLSPAGAMSIYTGQAAGSVHFILDVNGYFK